MEKEVKKTQRHHFNIAFLSVIIFVIIAVILSSKTPQEETPGQEMQPTVVQPKEKPQEEVVEEPPVEEVIEPEPPEETEPEVVEPPVEEEPAPVEEETREPVEEQPKTLETLSQAKCEDGYMSVVLTNTFDEAFSTVGLTWWITGKLNQNIQCDKEILQPGESTSCPKLNNYKLGGLRRITVYIFSKPYSVTVDCGKYTGA